MQPAFSALVVIETLLLMGGASWAWWIRAQKWTLKASVKAGLEIARHFQPAVELLGHAPSHDFPNMALWKAAQAALLENMKKGIRYHHHLERRATVATLAAVVAVIACNLCILQNPHHPYVELTAIWLPSLIGALYAFNFRKRTVQHIDTIRDFLLQLDFARVRIYAPSEEDPAVAQRLFQANLRLLCKIVAQFSQREFQFALADQPQVPL
jgi:hypothetical protein